MGTEYRFPTCYVSVLNSYFSANEAMFGGVLSSENYNSKVLFVNCVFEKNSAFLFSVSVGAGCLLMIKGNLFTRLETINCVFKDSGISNKGKKNN